MLGEQYQKHWTAPPVRYCESVSRPILIFFENLKHKLVTNQYLTGALKNELNIVLLLFFVFKFPFWTSSNSESAQIFLTKIF